MDCQRCGACCRTFSIPLAEADLGREPRLWDVAVPVQRVRNAVMRRYMAKRQHLWVIGKPGRGAACPFLAANWGGPTECLIYETRPQLCRDYPGETRCIRERQCQTSKA